MITGRVLSERVVSVSLSNGGLSQDVAQRKDIRFSSRRFKEFDAKTRSGKRKKRREGRREASTLTVGDSTKLFSALKVITQMLLSFQG